MSTIIDHEWCAACVGFPFLFDLSDNFSPLQISHGRETSYCSTCHLCIGSIRVLITGMLKIIGCDGFAYGFRFDLIFFAVLRDFFFYGFAVPYRTQWPRT